MKLNHQELALLLGAALLLSAPVAFAGNITIADNNSGTIIGGSWNGTAWVGGTHYTETSSASGGSSGDQRSFWRGQSGPAGEYQEVEPGMVDSADWDLAAFVNPAQGKLGVVSGYNLASGYESMTIGDIFISTNNHALTGYGDPNTNYPQFNSNSVFGNASLGNTKGWDYAIRMNFGANPSYTVIKLDANTVIENGEYSTQDYNAASQPWRVATSVSIAGGNLGQVIASGNMTYTSNANIATMGDSNHAGFAVSAAYKYYAEVGTEWLNSEGATSALYKLTMACGNDNMLGFQSGGFAQVPEESATLSLLGLGLMGVAGIAQLRHRHAR